LRKYDGLTSSVPEVNGCGLAVDINHVPDMSTGNETSPKNVFAMLTIVPYHCYKTVL
jgi:hypothetical protein